MAPLAGAVSSRELPNSLKERSVSAATSNLTPLRGLAANLAPLRGLAALVVPLSVLVARGGDGGGALGPRPPSSGGTIVFSPLRHLKQPRSAQALLSLTLPSRCSPHTTSQIDITVHNDTATTSISTTAEEYYTDEFAKQVKIDHPGAPRITGKDLPFKPPEDTPRSCPLLFARPGFKNAYVASIMTVFFSLLSQAAGMIVTMDYAMNKVLTTENPFVAFDDEEYADPSFQPISTLSVSALMCRYQRLGATRYANSQKMTAMWLYIILGLLLFVVLMASTQIASEFSRREWIYYELLQHGTLVDFKNRIGHLQFICSVKLFWVVLAFTALMLVAINCTGWVPVRANIHYAASVLVFPLQPEDDSGDGDQACEP